MMNEVKKLRAMLREAQEDGMSPDLYERIDAALAEPVTPAKLTEEHQLWVLRLCKAMLLWSKRAHGAYTIGFGTDQEEHFSPLELANRTLKELGIEAKFSEPLVRPAETKS